MDVSGKVALVTGGGRSIGRGIAITLAVNGADVVLADVNLDAAQAVASELEALGRKSMATKMDVTDQQSVDESVAEILVRFGRIDVLVNNAGVIAAPGWEDRDETTEADWDMLYAVNVKGVARVTEAVAPHMKGRRYGKIINIASIAGRYGTLTNIPYGISKAGVINYTQGSALGLAPFNVNVNAICPGLLWTPLWEKIGIQLGRRPSEDKGFSSREVFDRHVKRRIPLGREQTPEDIGNVAAFLASDYSSNITGQAINVSGGSHLN